MVLATMGGIGGGGVVVFLIMAFYSFTLKEALAISGVSILVCSATRFVINFR
jgi:uncharacterized membrane protein YfcA